MVYDVSYYCFAGSAGPDLAAWLAVFISALALGTTFWQAHLSRKHNKLSVRPHLAGHASWNDEGVYSLVLRNDGLGPAIITGARVFREGCLLPGEGPELVVKAFDNLPRCKLLGHEFFYLEHVVPAGKEIEICTVQFDAGIKDFDEYLSGLLLLELDYKSAYNEYCPMYTTRTV